MILPMNVPMNLPHDFFPHEFFPMKFSYEIFPFFIDFPMIIPPAVWRLSFPTHSARWCGYCDLLPKGRPQHLGCEKTLGK